jgi:hypothetical protein
VRQRREASNGYAVLIRFRRRLIRRSSWGELVSARHPSSASVASNVPMDLKR